MVGSVNVRIDGVNERGNGVLRTSKLMRECDVAILICMQALPHLKLPPCKVGLRFHSSVQAHVQVKVKDSDRPPQERPLHAGSHNLWPGTLEDNRKDLLKVSTKDNAKTTKWLVLTVPQIFKSGVNCPHNVLVLHGCLIPDDQVSFANQLCQVRLFLNVAGCRLSTGNGDLEAGMGSATTLEKKGSNPRGCNAKNDLLLGAQVVTEGVVKVGLASAPRTMKKEGLARLVANGRRDLVKSSTLIRIECRNTLCCKTALLLCIILCLLPDEWIFSQNCPVSHHLWHAGPISKPPAMSTEKLVNKVKPIVLDLSL